MRICRPDECHQELVACFREKAIVPVIGSGLSVGAVTSNGYVPDGKIFKEHMIKSIRKEAKLSPEESQLLETMSFSEIAGVYEDDELVSSEMRRRYLENHFYHARYTLDDRRRLFFDIDWPYIYSLNIDDTIENSTEYEPVLPQREFYDDIFIKRKCVLKLHGDIREIITYKASNKILSTKEYALSIINNHSMLNKLTVDFNNTNILFIGCSLLDEIDLLILDSLQLFSMKDRDFGNSRNECYIDKKNYIFVEKKPSSIEMSKYKQFGITDVVVFDEYSQIYPYLKNIWEESREQGNELDSYSQFEIHKISPDSKDNKEYFYMALNPIDYNNRIITCPYYFIIRKSISRLLEGINEFSIQIVISSKFSGKTYALVGVYISCNTKEKYLFDARTKLPDRSLELLLDKKNSLLLFDTDSLERNQIEIVLRKSREMEDRKTSVVLMINGNDSEALGLIRYMFEIGELKTDNCSIHRDLLPNRFQDNDMKKINMLLPEARLLPYEKDDTILNHLMTSAGKTRNRSKYENTFIPQKSIKEIAFSIAIASNEVLYYSDVVSLEFQDVISDIVNKCSPLIEEQLTNTYEMSPINMSRKKYVLNSKFWMRNSLIRLASGRNYETIKDAYRYLIEHLICNSKENINKRRKKYKKIIYFDTINDIFGGVRGGRLELISQIYESISDLIGTDFQYNHQRAKCLMENAFFQKHDSAKEREYSDARESALIARRQVTNEYETSHNEKMWISLAHIEYTYASIVSSLCDLHGYSDVSEIEEAISACYRAAVNPYNKDEISKEKERGRRYGIIYFVKQLVDNNAIDMISTRCRGQYEELVDGYMFGS